jgi:hypothetical protein
VAPVPISGMGSHELPGLASRIILNPGKYHCTGISSQVTQNLCIFQIPAIILLYILQNNILISCEVSTMVMQTTFIKHFGVMSVAKFGAIFGLIWGLIMGIVIALGLGAAAGMMGLGALGSVGAGALGVIMMIILGGIIGFIIGAIYAFIYNIIADAMGGIEMDLEMR